VQLEHVHLFKVLRHLPDTEGLAEFRGVVLVYDEATIDIDQQ
jgi:hypothetical protein